ncbi:MAG: poly-gamma-glutamate biosynthesis capsule formation protein [Paenibacillus sp.]|jgi:poly-gamma-glutamate synthesis protein (capsule biosynthesis protein)|nr:poly-gamma-glutamate biosynthesis capsule formation protein [Paenibacillus sp.]
MEHRSRKETYQRKRSHSKQKTKRRLYTTVAFVAISALVLVLWLIINNANSSNTASGADKPDQQEAGGKQPGKTAEVAGGSKTGTSGTTAQTGQNGQSNPSGQSGTGIPTAPSTETAKPDTGTSDPKAGQTAAGSTPSTGTTGGTPTGTAVDPVNVMDDPNRVQLTFVGDVIFSDNVETALKVNGYDYPYWYMRQYLEKADLTIANLETPLTDRGTPQEKEYAYRSSPNALPAFKDAGFDLVNLANNHILDYGAVGLLDTFTHLDKAGIRWFGAGHNTAEAFKPVIVEKKGIKIAFLGLSKVVPTQEWKAGPNRPGVADTYALKAPLEAIRNAKKQADLVVVVAHWGVERQDMPEKYQKDYAREYIDAGADLIIGGHPHVLQGFESYKGKWIAYSLGNFIFTMNENPTTWETIVLQASCAKDGGCALKAVPVLTKLANPQPMTDDAAAKLYKRLTDISFQTEITSDGTIRTKEKK